MQQSPELQCSICQRPTAVDGSCHYCLLQLGKSQPQSPQVQLDVDLPTPEQLQRSFPQLEVTRLIGRGGMGAIYHARQRSLDRDVALKVIARNVSNDPTFEERFTREAKTLARLSHPNIVTVHDFGTTEDGLVYLLMEYVDGVNLREAMDAGTIQPNEAIQIIAEMCAALQFAHDRGVVHRDIKPENVLLNEDGVVKVADFGLAKLLSDTPGNLTLTNTRQVMGTLRYMAPEQFEDSSAVDHRADVYSLGVVFYELLTGQIPVGRFDAPSRVNEGVSPSLDRIVMRTLDRKPPNRYQRVSEVASDLLNLQAAASLPGSLPPPYDATLLSPSVAFTASTLGNFAISVGNLKLVGDSLEVDYFTRDNILQIVKSNAKSVRIPLHEISKLEWKPGAFSSTITIVPQSISTAEQLPSTKDGSVVLRVSIADSQLAASLVLKATERFPALRNSSRIGLTQKYAAVDSGHLPTAKAVLGILFFICAALDFMGMIGIFVQLATLDEENLNRVPTLFAVIPIFTIPTITVKIIGGVYCFSPYSKRMPLAAATVSILPLSLGWAVSFFVGIWGWWLLGRSDSNSIHDRGIPLLRGLFGGSGSRMHTTLMYIRESRWSKFLAMANVVGLLALAAAFVVYRWELYPISMSFRVVAQSQSPDTSVVQLKDRLKFIHGGEGIACRHENNMIIIDCMKHSESAVLNAVAISQSVDLAWVIAQHEDNQALPGDQTQEIPLGGNIAAGTTSVTNSVFIGQRTTLQPHYCKGIAEIGNEFELTWTTEGRDAIEATQPAEEPLGLALIIDGLVEGFAPMDSQSNRSVRFSLAEGSKYEATAIESAIHGPELDAPVDFLRSSIQF